MTPHDRPDQPPSGPPRRDRLGLFTSVVEFFTSLTGLAAAALAVGAVSLRMSRSPWNFATAIL